MKRIVFASVLLGLVAVIAGCGESGKSDADLASIVQNAVKDASSVRVTERVQQYADSFRSPDDAGTTYVLKAEVVTPSGTVTRQFEVFVANADGWSNVKLKQ